MIINEKEILITKNEVKTNGKGEQYFAIDFVDMETGNSFNFITKDLDLGSKINKMTKYLVDLELRSTQYGLKIAIINNPDNLGTV